MATAPVFLPGESHGQRSLAGFSSQGFKELDMTIVTQDFPNILVGKEFACNAGRCPSIPGLGRSSGEGNSYPLQYPCLKNPMDREPGSLHSSWGHKSWTQLSMHTLAQYNKMRYTQFLVIYLSVEIIRSPGIYREKYHKYFRVSLGFCGGSVVKNLPASAGDMGSIPGLRRSPGGGDSTLLQYSCVESPMDRRAQQATVHWVCLRVGHNLETKQESLNGKCFICGCNKASRKYCTQTKNQSVFLALQLFKNQNFPELTPIIPLI